MTVVGDALGFITRVGGYFTVVSLIPSLTLTTGLGILAVSEPWAAGGPQLHLLTMHLGELSPQWILLWFLAAVVVSFVMHPLQYSLVQLMEGYWGAGAMGRRLGSWATSIHYLRFDEAQRLEQAALTRHDRAIVLGSADDELATTAYIAGAHTKFLADYPDRTSDIMPTQLGNVLRRYERRAGRPYGIDAVLFAPPLTLSAPDNQVAYLNDQRTQLDISVRFASIFFIMSLGWFCMLIPSGWWLTLCAGPYMLALLFYKGAVIVAHHYGAAVESVLDLSRRATYEQLGLSVPTSLAEERRQNRKLMRLLGERPRDASI